MMAASSSATNGDGMAPITICPTELDVIVANEIAAHTAPRTEDAAEALTWGADEHVLCALAAGWWLYARNKDKETRLTSDHVLLTTPAASALPHLLKTVFNQERPDRLTVSGHWRRHTVLGQPAQRFPLRTRRPHRRLGIGGQRSVHS
jgi:undecaprenyl-diphosphatase